MQKQLKQIRTHLKKIRALSRRKHHPLIHHVHKKYGISRKTLFYVKEYGAHSNVAKTIVKESIRILILTSIISSLGGLAIEQARTVFLSVIPIVMLMPALNDMIGDYGTIVSSRISTMLHEGRIKGNVLVNNDTKRLFKEIISVALIIAFLAVIFALGFDWLINGNFSIFIAAKVAGIVMLDVAVLVTALFFIALGMGIYYFRKKEDPNNFLIPITTSIADFANMAVLAGLVILFF